MTTPEFTAGADRLLRLLPLTHRLLDADPEPEDGFLFTLLGLIGEQVVELEDDLAQLYDDLFIETCAPWVVPYLGELVGVTAGHDVAGVSATTRAQVANVIALRRRKGTADVIEELAGDVTGWSARVVEMFQHVAVTQQLHHLRPGGATTVSLRSARDLELLGTAFDPFAHGVEARWIGSGRGRYDVSSIAVFLWPQVPAPFTDVDPLDVGGGRFRFHPLGIDCALLTAATGGSSVGAAATTVEVPWPISRRDLHHELTTPPPVDRRRYGPSGSVLVEVGGTPVDASDVVACSLGDDGAGGWEHAAEVPAGSVGIDPQRGRLVVGSGLQGEVLVSFHRAAPAPLGGGRYARPARPDDQRVPEVVARAQPAAHQTIGAALAAAGGAGLVVIDDSRTYDESPTVTVAADAELELRSADGRQPLLRATGGLTVTCDDGASVVLDGLLVADGPVVVDGRPDRIELRHCTLVPGLALTPDRQPVHPESPSLVVRCDDDVTPVITIDRCITGAVLVPALGRLVITDSIVEGGPLEGTAGGGGPEPAPQVVLVAVSGDLGPGPGLGPAPNEVLVLVGDDDPHVVDLGSPADADAVAAAFSAVPAVRALVSDGQVVLVGHGGRPLSVRDAGAGTAATDLGFDPATSLRMATLARPRPGPLTLTAGTPRLGLRHGQGPVVEVALAAVPGDLPAAAAELQAAVRGASSAAVHRGAVVGVVDDGLVVVPGTPDATLTVSAVPGDRTTAVELGLAAPLPAVASDGYGAAGPTLRVERATLLGAATATTVELASDAVFAGPLVAARGQDGCVRFSYLADGSRTPRRYRCLPDHQCRPPLAFESRRYGDAGYGALAAIEAAAPIRNGSSTGTDMGAHAGFQHRQREDNLRHQLDEFLRFSMEAGLLDGRVGTGETP